MNEKMYYSSPYITKWETSIRKTFQREDQYFVILEETAFYPTGGGQPFDAGTIDGIKVLDVFTDNDEVVHQLERLPETSSVNCELDWNRRFDHMQQHTGQHLLSAVCYSLYEARTISFHLGQDYSTIDIEMGALDQNQMDTIEQAVNAEIYMNRKVHTSFVIHEELQQLALLKMPKVTENIRIVEIEGIEHNACGGTHVRSTAEIGIIKLLKAEKQKGAVRLYFKCGQRALLDYNDSLKILGLISSKFNTSRSEILNRIEKWETEQRELEAEVKLLKEENNTYLAKDLLLHEKDGYLSYMFEGKSFDDTKELAIKVANENNLLILFAAITENRIILIHNGTNNISCGKFFKEHLCSFNGKGGGSDKSAQAGFSTKEDMFRFVEFASQNLVNNI
ncbi:alanyl-tRNA editing protein [Fictibacillus barbaricus]|uniref:Hydrolase n=1 Tax=Fictibacillus barbaricus TaxID=182136 RepID=A0ABS2ZDX4_9BACL|nr:alanine--tRNA ligase-related protein [Fictibacillus barbaricus]MBN3545559.1 hydrolase [Fictibacillus barbaricus]GGB54333.1 alanyl-tRNA editing protein [Fictibacillus barbaricus]